MKGRYAPAYSGSTSIILQVGFRMTSSRSLSSQLQRLAVRAAGGDDTAFAELFGHFRAHLKQFIELRLDQRVRRRVDPSDVLQETQMEVHRRLPDFLKREPMPLKVWLRRTAHEQLIRAHEKHLKADRRSVRREAQLANRSSVMLAKRFAATDPPPGQRMLDEERVQIVAQAIDGLPELDREILIMRNVEDLNFNEIAVSLDIEPAAARKRFGRALLRLQKQLRALDFGGLFE